MRLPASPVCRGRLVWSSRQVPTGVAFADVSWLDEDEIESPATHSSEVDIGGQERNRVRERIRRDQEVERLDADAAPREGIPDVARFVPEPRGLIERVAPPEEGEDSGPVTRSPETTPQLGDHRAAHRNVVRLEEPIDGAGEGCAAPEEVDPRRGVDKNQRRVSSRSSAIRTLPLSARRAERLALRSSSCKPSTIVGVMPLPVNLVAFSKTSAGRLTVTFLSRARIERV